MKTMQDFAAQQLSKRLMNEVMGGQQMITENLLLCRIYDGDHYIGCNYVIGSMNQIRQEALANGYSLHCDTNF